MNTWLCLIICSKVAEVHLYGIKFPVLEQRDFMEACLSVCNSLYRNNIRKRWGSFLNDHQSWKDAISIYKFNTRIANEMLIAKWIVNSCIRFNAASYLVKYFITFYCHSTHTASPPKINDKSLKAHLDTNPWTTKINLWPWNTQNFYLQNFQWCIVRDWFCTKLFLLLQGPIFFPCRAILFLQVSEGLPVWNMPVLFCQPQTNLTLFTMATLTQLSIPLFPW